MYISFVPFYNVEHYWSHTRLFRSPSIFQSPSFRFYSFCWKIMSCFDVTALLASGSRLIDRLIAIVALSEQSMVGEDIENVWCVALLCNWFLIQVWIKQERTITFLHLAAAGSRSFKRWVPGRVTGHVITCCLASSIVKRNIFTVTVVIRIGVILGTATSPLASVWCEIKAIQVVTSRASKPGKRAKKIPHIISLWELQTYLTLFKKTSQEYNNGTPNSETIEFLFV